MTLDPKSAQVRDVYAHFGLAMYFAQCLEQSIFQHLLFFDYFPEAIATYTTQENWGEKFDHYESRELAQTLGKLIRRLREVGQPTKEIEGLLAESLKSRNWLAHGYFADRAIEFTLPEGQLQMITELEVLQEQFRRCSDQLDAITLPVAHKFGLTEEALARMEAEMVAEHVKRKKGN